VTIYAKVERALDHIDGEFLVPCTWAYLSYSHLPDVAINPTTTLMEAEQSMEVCTLSFHHVFIALTSLFCNLAMGELAPRPSAFLRTKSSSSTINV